MSAIANTFNVASTTVRYNRGERMIFAFQSRPRDMGTYPGALVLHDTLGLTPAVKEATRRLARHDVMASAPDLYSRAETPVEAKLQDLDARRKWFGQLPDQRVMDDLERSWEVFGRLHWVYRKKLAIIGFGMGAYYALLSAARRPEVAAVVAITPQYLFDQDPGKGEDLKPFKLDDDGLINMKAKLFTVFAGQDEGLSADQRQAWLDLCDRQYLTHTHVCYDGAGPAFWDEQHAGHQPDTTADMWSGITSFLDGTCR